MIEWPYVGGDQWNRRHTKADDLTPDNVEHTLEQLKELHSKYDGNFFIFMDSLLNGLS